MRLRLLSLVLSLCVLGLIGTPWCQAAEPEHPFKNVAVGDWATYDGAADTDKPPFLKYTVSAKDDKEVTIKVAITFPDQNLRGLDIKVDLTKLFDPTNIRAPDGAVMTEVTKGDVGKETVTIGKTKYECQWSTTTIIAKNPKKNAEAKYEYKVWTCADAPLGIVKMEVKRDGVAYWNLILHEGGKGK